jgi:sugar lactone lactonase YvrE
MTIPEVHLVADLRNTVGESPFWDVASQSLYWVDIPNATIFNFVAATGVIRQWKTPEMVACIARRSDGRLIAGLESGIFTLSLENDGMVQTERLASAAHQSSPMRFNDGRCDRQGRFWAGTMHLDMSKGLPVGMVHRFDRHGLSGPQFTDLIVPNGMAWSPDGRTMYLSDSHPDVQAIWAMDYDIDDGVASNRRLWIDMREYPGRPDGAAVDAEGCYWICGNDAGMVHRFTPEGRLERSVHVPVKKPAMCAFGGSDMGTLYVTSIRPGGVDLSDQPLAGGIFAFRPGVTGIAETPFAA